MFISICLLFYVIISTINQLKQTIFWSKWITKLLKIPSENTQPNLFYGSLMDVLDSKDPLIVLADTIKWEIFETDFKKYYSKNGRPAKPIRLMVGLLLLKQLENLSDENIVLQFKRNPYYQYFCGFSDYQPALPCCATDLVYFSVFFDEN